MPRSSSALAAVLAAGLLTLLAVDAAAQTPVQHPATQPIPTLPSTPEPGAAGLPNGATSISETYGDWSVHCDTDGAGKICAISQSQGNKESGQRSFAIELRTPREGRADGTILVPFGMNLEAGAVLKLDGKDLGQGLRFSTCVQQGCLLPVSFPAVATDAMKSAQKLTVSMLNLGNGQAVTFTVPLNGFPSALQRVSTLGGAS